MAVDHLMAAVAAVCLRFLSLFACFLRFFFFLSFFSSSGGNFFGLVVLVSFSSSTPLRLSLGIFLLLAILLRRFLPLYSVSFFLAPKGYLGGDSRLRPNRRGASLLQNR